jgi:dipeptidyl aminopeptidase/acylaminoacyl peptidase
MEYALLSYCMIMKYSLAIFLSIFIINGNAQNTLTPELLWKMKRISGGTLSPDGRYLLFSQRSFDLDKNKGNTDLFVINIKENSIAQLTNTSFSEFEAQWHKDNSIWFLSNENNGVQIWRMNPDGTEKMQCSSFQDKEIEGFKLAPDGKNIITIEAIQYKQSINEIYADLPLANARVEDDLMYRHWDHYDDYKKRHLMLYEMEENLMQVSISGTDILNGEPYDGILPPMGGSEQFTFSNDGKKVVYTSKKMTGKAFALHTNSDLYEYDITSKTTVNITEAFKGYDNNPSFNLMGQMAWLSMARDGFESDKNDIVLKDGTSTTNLTAELDLSVTDFSWHPDGEKLYFTSAVKGTVQMFEITLKKGKTPIIKQITEGIFDVVSISVGMDAIYFGRQSMIEPTDLYALNLKNSKMNRLTNVNKVITDKLSMPTVEERWVKTSDGKQMLVWMVLPPNFDQNNKYPALLYCQGGPQSPVSQYFSYRWNLALMASKGYVVIAPNRRGLPGFGQEWNDAISKDWGGQAMEDYLAAVDDAVTLPYIDAQRLGAVGASYGGYSVYMLAGIHQKRFKTFVSHCGLFNLESWYGTTEELFFADWDQGGPYWMDINKENYKKNSPHNYVQNWDTPILVIHGGLDFRVPESEGIQAFQAAQLLGLKSRFLQFPSEGHWVQSPQNSILWQREFFRWLEEDLKP